MALLVSGALHLVGLALLAGFAGAELYAVTEPDHDDVPDRVWLDGPVVGSHARADEADGRRGGVPKAEPAQPEPQAEPPSPDPGSPATRSRTLDRPQDESPVAIPTGTDLAAIELAPGEPLDAGGSPEQEEGPIPMGVADGSGPPQIVWGDGDWGGWEGDYGRLLASRIEREAEDADLGPRPRRLKKSLVVVVEVDSKGRLIRQEDGSYIKVVKSRVTGTAEKSLLAAVKRASEDFPPFPVQGAKDSFTLEVRFRLGPDGLSIRR